MSEEKDELTVCPMCDEEFPRKTVILIGRPSGKHYLTEEFLDKLNKAFEDAEIAKDFYVLEPSPAQEVVLPRKYNPDDLLSPQERFLKKKEKYNKRRRR